MQIDIWVEKYPGRCNKDHGSSERICGLTSSCHENGQVYHFSPFGKGYQWWVRLFQPSVWHNEV